MLSLLKFVSSYIFLSHPHCLFNAKLESPPRILSRKLQICTHQHWRWSLSRTCYYFKISNTLDVIIIGWVGGGELHVYINTSCTFQMMQHKTSLSLYTQCLRKILKIHNTRDHTEILKSKEFYTILYQYWICLYPQFHLFGHYRNIAFEFIEKCGSLDYNTCVKHI